MMGYGWVGGFGWIVMLAWLVLLALIVWSLSAGLHRSTDDGTAEALRTLKRRYAAGEISLEEFETARRAIS